jgi:glycine/D-amino acid oxidase-like deaminating enzyme
VVVGGGIAGLALAVELRRLACAVTVVEERYPGAGNSTRNVGRIRRMQLTPDLTEFSCRASDKWRTVHRLTGGRSPLLYPTRYVWVLYDEDERAALAPMQEMWDAHGARARIVEAEAVLRAVPVLEGGEPPVGGVIGEAAIVHHDAAVYAYMLAARESGVRLRTGERATELELDGDRAAGVRTDAGELIRADAVVNAAGTWGGDVARLAGVHLPIEPRRGFILVTEPVAGRAGEPLVRHKVYTAQYVANVASVAAGLETSAVVEGTRAGTVLIGASRERVGFDRTVSLPVLRRLAHQAITLFPALAQVAAIRTYCGFRPYSPDHLPVVGADPRVPGLLHACGHEGGGIGLAAATGYLIAQVLTGARPDIDLTSYRPDRFAESTA